MVCIEQRVLCILTILPIADKLNSVLWVQF